MKLIGTKQSIVHFQHEDWPSAKSGIKSPLLSLNTLSLLLALAGSGLATPVSPLAVFHELTQLPASWASKRAAPKDTLIKAQIGLKQSNIAWLQEKLLDISNPDNPNYGKWLKKEEVNALTAPSAENIAAVKSWLAANGITEVNQASPDWIDFTVPVSKMESLLGAKYELFHHATDGTVPRTLKYSVPKHLHSVIDMVTPTTAFYNKVSPSIDEDKALVARNTQAVCDTTKLTTTCLKQLYNVDYTPKGNALVATTQFLTQQASHDDYKSFNTQFGNPSAADFQDISVSGGKNSGTASDPNNLIEANLDTQWAGGLASPNPSQFLACSQGSAPSSFQDDFSNFASYLTSTNSPPTSVSTSYAGNELGLTPPTWIVSATSS